MNVRDLAATRVGAPLADALDRFNARHPWSHNDHFHGWILTNLPAQRSRALDIGCGRGELLAALAGRFDAVLGTDTDAPMREAARARCAGLPNVRVAATPLSELQGPFDLVTMVAVLHHLDVPDALARVRDLVAPGGRLLVVGLARPESLVDHAWDAASVVTNPVIGWVKHPWRSEESRDVAPFPVAEPMWTYADLGRTARAILPGVELRRHLGFRHTLAWAKPDRPQG